MCELEKKKNAIFIQENIKMILPEKIKTVHQCQRGFWWGNEFNSSDITGNNTDKWSSNSILLHEEKETLTPIRTKVNDKYLGKTYEPKMISVRKNETVIIIATK